jgi:thymidylate synthase ThyX
MEVTFPRMVLAEFNTHRVFSRNSASSRAIPVKKQLEKIVADPFIPVYWGKNQSGMQASTELAGKERQAAIRDWLTARYYAVDQVKRLLELDTHKQIANRLLEPFMWHTVVVTATEWENFFALRANKDAQPEIRVIAEMMRELYATSQPAVLAKGEWHLPLIQPEERDGTFEHSEEARKVSAARCARVSYLTHVGRRDLSADITLYNRLVSGGHMSPLEHVATPAWHVESTPYEHRTSGWDDGNPHQVSEWHGNFRGWKQLRKFIPSENIFQG